MAAVQLVITEDTILNRNQALLPSIPGIGIVTASALLTELSNISGFMPRGLAAFAGRSPQEHGSGTAARDASVGQDLNAYAEHFTCAFSAVKAAIRHWLAS